MNKEIVIAISGVFDDNSDHLRLKEMATDKRRKFKDIVQREIYLKSPEFLEKFERLGSTMPEFALVGSVGILASGQKYIYALADPNPSKLSKLHPRLGEGPANTKYHWFESEKEVITAFWDQFRKEYDTLARYGHSYPCVGYKILSWGLPFLLKRSSIHGITASRELSLRTDYNAGIYDLAMKWDQSVHPWTSLELISELFGEPYDGTFHSELDTVWEIYKKVKGNLIW